MDRTVVIKFLLKYFEILNLNQFITLTLRNL